MEQEEVRFLLPVQKQRQIKRYMRHKWHKINAGTAQCERCGVVRLWHHRLMQYVYTYPTPNQRLDMLTEGNLLMYNPGCIYPPNSAKPKNLFYMSNQKIKQK